MFITYYAYIYIKNDIKFKFCSNIIMSRSYSSPKPHAPKQYNIRHPPQYHPTTPGLIGSILQGFSFGAGSSMGHRAVDGIFNSAKIYDMNPVAKIPSSIKNDDDCLEKLELYQQCMNNNFTQCESLYNNYFECTKKSTTF